MAVPRDDCILRGYAPPAAAGGGWQGSLPGRALSWHNETLNIWTHLAPALWFAWRARRACGERRWPLAAFALSVACLLGCSAAFHALLTEAWRTADFCAIAVTMWAGHLPHVGPAFRGSRALAGAWMAAATAAGLGVLGAATRPEFHAPEFHARRAAAYAAQGAGALASVLHAAWLGSLPRRALLLEAGNLACQALGAAVYVARMPECGWPGTFDLVGQSHTTFHVLVVAGFALHLRAAELLAAGTEEEERKQS
jgi:adiponectin receptor